VYEAWIDDIETNVSTSDSARRARAAIAHALPRKQLASKLDQLPPVDRTEAQS
jgi:hypothetical protein